MGDDSALLDYADQFCAQRGGGDRFATLGLALDSGSEIDNPPVSFREALHNLRSGDTESNRDAAVARIVALFWTNGVSGDRAREIVIQEFGQQTADAAANWLKSIR